MLPTLACKASAQQSAVDTLLMRCMPRPNLRSIFSGDVVAFGSPLAPAADDSAIMVRRVAAVEGEDLVTDDPSDGSFTIPEGTACAWAPACGLFWEEMLSARSPDP